MEAPRAAPRTAAKIGFWKGPWTLGIAHFGEATSLDPQYHKAWYEWWWIAATKGQPSRKSRHPFSASASARDRLLTLANRPFIRILMIILMDSHH
jgi:hypothetical protein